MPLSDLPDVNFVDTDVETLLAEMISDYEKAYYKQTGVRKTLQPGDPIRIWIYSQALKYYQLLLLLDHTAKQNLLRYAVGNYLDHRGTWYGERGARLSATNATTTIRYTLSDAQTTAVTIPAGNRTSPGNGVFFATKEAAEIPAGQLYVDVVAECTESGTIGNGYAPGQINVMVDPIPYVASVANITTSQGGADVESDDNYRERLYSVPDSFSVAGPTGAYEYFTKQYSPAIADAKETSPSPGVVDVRFILQNGELPNETLIEEVQAYLSPKDRRPLTDNVTVQAPTVVNYDINLTYYIRTEDANYAESIQAAVTAAVDDYVIWQKSKIGRSINPDELKARIRAAGAKRSEITSPVYTAIEETELAVAQNITITYGGLEDE